MWQSQHLLSPENIKRAVTASCEPPKYGHKQLAITKILAAFTLFVVTFLVGITVHILILDAAFGTDCLKTSFQMRYSIINLPNINLGQLQIILAAAGLLSVLATVSCTLFLSAKCKDTLTVLLISIVVLLMPLFCLCGDGSNMALYHTSICRNWYAEQFPFSACRFQLSEYRWNEFLDTACYFDFGRN